MERSSLNLNLIDVRCITTLPLHSVHHTLSLNSWERPQINARMTSRQPEPFVYQPLSKPKNIRSIWLEPGKQDDTIELSVCEVLLTSSRKPKLFSQLAGAFSKPQLMEAALPRIMTITHSLTYGESH